MTPTAGWMGLVSGTAAAILVGVLSKDALGGLSIGRDRPEGPGRQLRRGRCGLRRRHRGQHRRHAWSPTPRQESELRGLVYSLTPKSDFHDANEGVLAVVPEAEHAAGVAVAMVIVLNIIFW